uniref:Uncharacterized protein n=1 Tax=Anguilla anguilla TaxID=7936 RepID=A0A0E9SYL1_ANGAN
MRPGEEAAEGELRDTSRLLRDGSEEALKLTGSTDDFSGSSPPSCRDCPALWGLSGERDPGKAAGTWLHIAESSLRPLGQCWPEDSSL